MERNAEALAAKIRSWELHAGESFTDYYMHDSVKDVSWAFWLLGKGFNARANELIDLIQVGNQCIDQELLYHLHYDDANYGGDWGKVEHVYLKDVLLWAEFLIASDRYWKDVTDFFTEADDSK
jgi:hypothetical protein